MPIDYSRFDNIDVSDDEDEQAYKARKAAEEAGRRASKAQAKECVEAWWQACPKQSQFTVECAARLTRAGTTSLYNNTSGPLKGLGLGFERPLTKDDSLETVQGLLKYVALERIGLPGLTGVPEGWDVFGRPPASRIELDDDEGQTFSIEAWDGSKLKATVRKARVVALEGHDLCGNQISGVLRYRRDVVPVIASARWRRAPTPSMRRCPHNASARRFRRSRKIT